MRGGGGGGGAFWNFWTYGGGKISMPPVVGVRIFSGTTHLGLLIIDISDKCDFEYLSVSKVSHVVAIAACCLKLATWGQLLC